MPITRIIYTGKAANSEILDKLWSGLQEIIAEELSTSDFKLEKDSVELIFEKGSAYNLGKDLKILIDGNDFPERTKDVEDRAKRIAARVEKLICPSAVFNGPAFVYITLQAGGLGNFWF